MSRNVAMPVRHNGRWRRTIMLLNTGWHRRALVAFMVIVMAHWAEHVAQAIQIYLLGWPVHRAGGLLGLLYPWLVHSEWLHYGFALTMLVGLIVLRPGFLGRSRGWWTAALGIQVWHHFEHLLLLVQALTGSYLFGRAAPTSIIQLLVPRVELHLFYNAAVFVPMMIAFVAHRRPGARVRVDMQCTCAVVGSRRIPQRTPGRHADQIT